jgi:hypothetical protein
MNQNATFPNQYYQQQQPLYYPSVTPHLQSSMYGIMHTQSSYVIPPSSASKPVGGLLSTLPLAKPQQLHSRAHGIHSQHQLSFQPPSAVWQYPSFHASTMNMPTIPPHAAPVNQQSAPIRPMLQQQQQQQTPAFNHITKKHHDAEHSITQDQHLLTKVPETTMQNRTKTNQRDNNKHNGKPLSNGNQHKKKPPKEYNGNKLSSQSHEKQLVTTEIDPNAGSYQEFNVEGQRFNILVSYDQSEIDDWIKQRKSRFPTKQRVDMKSERNELQNLCGGSNSGQVAEVPTGLSTVGTDNAADLLRSTTVDPDRPIDSKLKENQGFKQQRNLQKKRKFKQQGDVHDAESGSIEPKNLQQPVKQQKRKQLVDLSVGLFDKLTKTTRDDEENVILQCIHFVCQELLVDQKSPNSSV